jgi:hypothetical protein
VHRKVTRCSFIIAHEGHERGIYIGAEYLCFVLGDHVYFEILCTMTTVTMEGFETGRPLYSTIDDIFLICFGRV